ncbi:hypothetical protein [Bergeyella zoohelcum]|uniref:Lipoprotein n=1 Tax=Bergeyella zoohelcum ATCC 43767 TaxID=883096 RepID=K1LWL4_9FLAO|nr:hypothetical protein [Bergeyella zoohelcum]EKB59371.1 hypothetical protein HMPREF9699_00307 [Bergeyella zoohelcum ATCC 43767]SUV49517.1 Uncharacterised protein [Bergeyella zoohelcum]
MKHLKTLLPLLILSFLISCGKHHKKEDSFTLTDTEKSKIERIVENHLKGELFSKTGKHVPVRVENSIVKEIDGNMYIVSTYGEYTSTSLLDKNTSTMEYEYAGITCTSSGCSANNECIPKSKASCTPCTLGDCSKSVTSFE